MSEVCYDEHSLEELRKDVVLIPEANDLKFRADSAAKWRYFIELALAYRLWQLENKGDY